MMRNLSPMIDRRLSALRRRQRGSVMIIVALLFSTLMVFMAMALDLGRALARKEQLANACDAAALAGGQQLPNTSRAAAAANRLFAATFSSPIYTAQTTATEVQTTAEEAVPTSFARLGGVPALTVRAAARLTRLATPVNEVSEGITPWAIVQGEYAPGATVTLMLGGGSGSGGNFYALALGGTGAGAYSDNIKYGYKGTLGSGDELSADTEPGAMTGPTRDAVNYRIGLATSNPAYASDTATNYSGTNPRILLVPMVQSWVDVSGRTQVRISGFAAVYLNGMHGSEVQATFVGASLRRGSTVASRPAGADFGVNPVKLLE